MASRYAAVFPLSELINWIYHTRGQRHEELPHSYQMMLFWAGLRGAVGVALAAGITGDNADALRTTILVVVVLTVIVFGGTTARMLEVLGIRVGVEDEDASSDEEGWTSHHGDLALQIGAGNRRFAGANGRGMYAEDGEEMGLSSPINSPYLSSNIPISARRADATRPGMGAGHRSSSRSGFSSNSDESDDGEVLPPHRVNEDGTGFDVAGDAVAGEEGGPSQPGMVFRDGQWFTALDERYLLPLFSNSVTARRHQAKKARKASVYPGGESGPGTPRLGASFDLTREDGDYVADGESENGKVKVSRNFRFVLRFFFA